VSTPDTPALPQPDELAVAHSTLLVEHIRQALANGPMSFADYMQMALYEPGLGYYMAGAQKFGAGGDFTTAPEVSALFGQCLAAQCTQVLQLIGGGSVLEMGAGSGRLAQSMLDAMSDEPPDHYLILEPSAELQQRQYQYLKQALNQDLFARIQWLDALPENFVGVCIANEVMDALPVELFTKLDGDIRQVCVHNDKHGLGYTTRTASDSLRQLVSDIEDELQTSFTQGYRSEVCPLLSPWIESLAASIKKGVVLLCDYGYPRREYYLPERNNGTLACYYRHHFHDDVFFYPGLQDLTAHVDFTRVIEAGSSAGMALLGYTSQTGFLLNNGISTLAATQLEACTTEQSQLTLAREVKVLTLPGEMGERFQFMALGKNVTSALQGFATQDISHRL